MRLFQINKTSREHISLVTNVSAAQISESETHFTIKGIPVVVDGAEMNGIIYNKEDNDKGLDTLIDKVLTLGHPFSDDGLPIDAYSSKALQDNFAGGVVTNRYKSGSVNLVDVEIKKRLLLAQDGGEWYYNQLQSKKPIGVSTGLYHVVKDGKSTEQMYNHLALLPEDEAPAGGDATFIRFNSVKTLAVNIDEHIKAMEENTESTLVERIVNSLAVRFASIFKISNNEAAANGNDPEGKAMLKREDVMNMLKAKKVSVNEDMSDDELKALLSKSLAGNSANDNQGQKGALELNSDILGQIGTLLDSKLAPVNERIGRIETAATNAQKSQKEAVIASIMAVNTVYTKEELEAMPETALNKMASQFVPAMGLSMSALQFNQSAPASAVALSLPNVE